MSKIEQDLSRIILDVFNDNSDSDEVEDAVLKTVSENPLDKKEKLEQKSFVEKSSKDPRKEMFSDTLTVQDVMDIFDEDSENEMDEAEHLFQQSKTNKRMPLRSREAKNA